MSNFYHKKIDFPKGKINIPLIKNISFLNNSISINVDIDNEPDLEPIKSILRKRKNKSILKEEYKMINKFIKHLSTLDINNILVKKTTDVKDSIEFNLKNIFNLDTLQIKKIYWVHIDDNKQNSIKLSFMDKEDNLNTLIETNYNESIDDYNYRMILELHNNLFLYIKDKYNFCSKEKSKDTSVIICISSKYNYLVHYFLNDLEYCYYMQETEYIDS